MSEPQDLTVRNQEDYARNVALASAALARIDAQSILENWTPERRDQEKVEALLPYYRANSDPASKAAKQAMLDEYLSEQGDSAIILSDTSFPELYAILAQQTQTLNSVHGVNFEPPPIILQDGLFSAHKTPLLFRNDAVIIDKKYFENKYEKLQFVSAIGHELGHRYQRSDEELKLFIKANELELTLLDDDIQRVRGMEAEADFDARRVSPPGAMASFIRDYVYDAATAIGYVAKSNPHLSISEAVASYNRLSVQERQQINNQLGSLSYVEREKFFIPGIRALDAYASNDAHLLLEDRLDLLAALDRYPAVLSCRNVQFDGSATIIEATNCGPGDVPLVVNGVPTSNRVRQ